MKRFAKSASALAIAGAVALGAAPASFAQDAVVPISIPAGCGLDSSLKMQVDLFNATPTETGRAELQAKVDSACPAEETAPATFDGRAIAVATKDACKLSPATVRLVEQYNAKAQADRTEVEYNGVTAAVNADIALNDAQKCDEGNGVGLAPLLGAAAILGSSALLSSGGSSEQGAPAPAPAPAPEAPAEKPAAPEKGINPNAPQKGIDPNANKAAQPAPAKQQRGTLAQTGANSIAPIVIMFALTLAGCAAFIIRRKSA